jgi:hypothetical protein
MMRESPVEKVDEAKGTLDNQGFQIIRRRDP